jgi:uncharacterized protein DUF2637
VPPIALLTAVHGIALAVRAGASGRVYWWAITATGLIGLGGFAVSFIALRDLMRAIGYTSATAWAFPAIVDTAVAVSTLMLLALGDKPVRRGRSAITPASTQSPALQRAAQNAKPHFTPVRPARTACTDSADRPGEGIASLQLDPPRKPGEGIASLQLDPPRTLRSAQAEVAQDDADLASDLIESGVTTQSLDTVIAVLSAYREGASINAAAKASGINYRTAQRIVEAAAEHRQNLMVASLTGYRAQGARRSTAAQERTVCCCVCTDALSPQPVRSTACRSFQRPTEPTVSPGDSWCCQRSLNTPNTE